MQCTGVWYMFAEVSEELAFILSHQNVGRILLQNVCKYKPDYTASHQCLESPP